VELGVSTDPIPGGRLVEVSGEVDLHTAPQLRAALSLAIDQADASSAVLVDLSRVSFIDSTGLGELVAAHKALQAHDASLHLVAGHDRVRRLLALTGLDEVLSVHPDRAAALLAVAGE